MKTQQISLQNFNGSLVYITRNGEKHVSDVQNRLPNIYRECRKAVEDSLRDEAFDVFISRGKNPLDFVVKATDGKNSTVPVTLKLKTKQFRESRPDYYENPEDFAAAIFKSIADFKKGIFKI